MIPNLFFAINEDCNLDCTYCNVKKSKQKLSEKELIEGILYFIKFFPESEKYNIYFTGGEPLLSFREIITTTYFLSKLEKKIQKKFQVHVPTNGTLLNEERIRLFKQLNIILSLSIDSFDADYRDRPLAGNNNIQSQLLLERQVPLFIKYSEIFRIKMVATPGRDSLTLGTFEKLYNLGFHFINIQPAHGVFWSEQDQASYISMIQKLKETIHTFPGLESTTLKKSASHTHTLRRCAKGNSEICIDSYGDIYTCDAFLAYEPSVRKAFAFDSIHKPHFDREKFRKGAEWRYCENEIISGKDGSIEKDLTNCKTCNESISCSKLCNAVPINGKDLEKRVMLSNFEFFRKIDALL